MATIVEAGKYFEKIRSNDQTMLKGTYGNNYYLKYKERYGIHLFAKNSEQFIDGSDGIIYFNLYAANCAAQFLNHKGKIWLAHDGRFSHRVKFKTVSSKFGTAQAGGRAYHLVSDIDDKDFFKNVVEFHLSRIPLGHINGRNPSAKRIFKGQNGGSEGQYRVESSDRDPKHKFVVDSLRLALNLDWKTVDNNLVSPDLFVSKNQLNVLFEVKPSLDFSNLCHAVGQLIYYSKYLNCHRKIYVAFGLPNSFSDADDHVKNLKEIGISFLEAKLDGKSGKKYIFPRLDEIMDRINESLK